MIRWARGSRGQAATEFAIMLPVMIMLMLGAADLARAFYLDIETSGAARAGARAGVTGDTVDIGDFIRSEPNTAIPNTVAAWGDTGPGQTNADCTSAPSAQHCGDPNGCPATVFTGTRVACFAIRKCELYGTTPDLAPCKFLGSWNTRPDKVGNSDARELIVLVTYKFQTVTPFLGAVAGVTGSSITLKTQASGLELYY